MNENNPYHSPQSNLVNSERDTENAVPFFSVSLFKLFIMSFVTGGLYEVYWFYKNWKIIKDLNRFNTVPAMRAVFAIFFCYPLFRRIRQYEAGNKYSKLLPAGLLATGWVLTTLAGYFLPSPWDSFSFLPVLFLLVVQSHVNRINKNVSPEHDPNEHFSVINWIFIILFFGVLAYFAIGLLYAIYL